MPSTTVAANQSLDTRSMPPPDLPAPHIMKASEIDTVGSRECVEKLTSVLESLGFRGINDPEHKITSDGEVIFNRGSETKSNFFVFIDASGRRPIAYFTNPSRNTAPERRDSLRIRIEHDPRETPEEWSKRVGESVSAVEKEKPEDIRFFEAHSHVGFVVEHAGGRVKARALRDDGVSSDRDKIREMMYYHYDYGAVTCHNLFDSDAFRIVQDKADLANIRMIPGAEITIPVKDNSTRGFHVLAWFSDAETGEEIQRNLLSRKTRGVPSLALAGSTWEVLDHLDDYRQRGKLALGLAHPAGDPVLPRDGIFDYIIQGRLDFNDLLKVLGYMDSVGMFNAYPSVGDIFGFKVELPFNRRIASCRKIEDWARRKMVENPELGTLLTPNTMNIILAESMEKNTHFETDEHASPKIGPRMPKGLMGTGRTEIQWELKRAPTVEELIHVIRDGVVNFGDIVYPVRFDAQPFYELDPEGRMIVVRRDLNPGLSLERLTSAVRQIGRDIAFGLRLR